MSRFRRPRWWTPTSSIIIAASLAMIAFGSWSVASPIGASPDDDYHMASIWCGLGERDGLCEAGTADDERLVPARAFQSSACFAFDPAQSADCDFPADDVLLPTGRGNFVDNGYPPLFYGFMSVFASPDVATSTIVMRLANSAIFVGLIVGIGLLLPLERRRTLVVATTATIVPLGMFIIPSVNPSSWAVVSAATLWIALVGFFEATEPRREVALGTLAMVAAIIGAGARADSAVYNGVAVVAALIIAGKRSRTTLIKLSVPFVIGCFSLYSFATSGQSDAEVAPVSSALTWQTIVDLMSYNVPRLPELWAGVFGTWSLGWFDTPMPGGVWVLTIAVFAGAAFAGLAVMTRRKTWAIAFVLFCLIAIPLAILTRSEIRIGEYVQPRYFLPLIIILTGVIIIGSLHQRYAFTPTQTGVAIALLAIANAIALSFNIRRYVTGTDVISPNLNSRVEWWWDGPVSPMAVWGIGLVAFTAALIAIAAADRVAQTPLSGDAQTHDRRPTPSPTT